MTPRQVALVQESWERVARVLSMVSLAVESLDRPEAIAPALRVLGRRHAAAFERQYAAIEETFVALARHCLGGRFTAETEQAWRAACAELAALAKDPALEERRAA